MLPMFYYGGWGGPGCTPHGCRVSIVPSMSDWGRNFRRVSIEAAWCRKRLRAGSIGLSELATRASSELLRRDIGPISG